MKSFNRPSKTSTKLPSIVQRKSQPTRGIIDNRPTAVIQRKLQDAINVSPRGFGGNFGKPLPQQLKASLETQSGYSLDDVKVHYNSQKPAEVGALAYAQGNNIYLAPGQEKHLGHEAWHVVQQKQGRVRPTVELENGAVINDNVGLEQEAERMGQHSTLIDNSPLVEKELADTNGQSTVIQRVLYMGTAKKDNNIFTGINSKFKDSEDEALSPFTGYTVGEIRAFMHASAHYGYDRNTGEIFEIGAKKRKKLDPVTEITGWMGEVDKGTDKYSENGTTKIAFEARKLKDEKKGGFNVGINNVANLTGLKKTNKVSMTKRQKKIITLQIM